MLIGYARVSTDDQNLDLQINALKEANCDHICCDKGYSGALRSRPALDDAIAGLRQGDTLITWKLDRLGRSLSHLIALIADLEKKGVAFKSISDAIDTSTPGGRLQFHMLGALAEFERSLISERTKAGLAAARARGHMGGRPSKLSPKQAEEAVVHYRRLRSLAKVAKLFSVSPLTIRRAVERR